MKKLLSVCLALAMMLCLGVTAFAEGGFVSSPSANEAPEIVNSSSSGIIVTPYSNRNQLPSGQLSVLEEAYNSIKQNEDLTKLNSELSGIANGKNVKPENLAVSDLFNVSSKDTNASGEYTLTLSADTFKNFVALMAYVNGKWVIVDGAKLQNGNLVFTASNFGPYAVVVNGEATLSPQTGVNEAVNSDSTMLFVYAAITLVSLCGAAAMWKKSKKYSA